MAGTLKGYSLTQGQQGGIGYPPLILKHQNKWWFVNESRNHGGTVCQTCSKDRGIASGYTPQRWGQPEPFGSRCYRSLLPITSTVPTLTQAFSRTINWPDAVILIKETYGDPKIIAKGVLK